MTSLRTVASLLCAFILYRFLGPVYGYWLSFLVAPVAVVWAVRGPRFRLMSIEFFAALVAGFVILNQIQFNTWAWDKFFFWVAAVTLAIGFLRHRQYVLEYMPAVLIWLAISREARFAYVFQFNNTWDGGLAASATYNAILGTAMVGVGVYGLLANPHPPATAFDLPATKSSRTQGHDPFRFLAIGIGLFMIFGSFVVSQAAIAVIPTIALIIGAALYPRVPRVADRVPILVWIIGIISTFAIGAIFSSPLVSLDTLSASMPGRALLSSYLPPMIWAFPIAAALIESRRSPYLAAIGLAGSVLAAAILTHADVYGAGRILMMIRSIWITALLSVAVERTANAASPRAIQAPSPPHPVADPLPSP